MEPLRSSLRSLASWGFRRALANVDDDSAYDDHGGGDGHHSEFGVHISFDDLYASVVFFAAIYVCGAISAKLLRMPSLVGEVFCGILLGPPLASFVPNPVAFVTLGEIGLILLVLEAGIDVDMTTLKLIGTRGVIVAVVGSVLPIAVGVGIALALGTDVRGSLAAGAAFGPTSLGIAMNVLKAGKIANTPVGQLIVSAAVIDDMIALIILSQLEALAGEMTVASVLVPVVSALAYLVVGGAVAIAVLPGWIERLILSRVDPSNRSKAELAIMLSMLILLMPATYYSKASFLMGAFVAGLTFCRSHGLHALFASQFKRILQWLMRIFFAASIGFQVPVKDFANGTVVWQGAVFTLALTGKLAVGFLVPNFNATKRFTGLHLRDCLVTGFSMAAEGEFAFVIAVFAVDQGLIGKDLYASIVLAVLFSTILPPFLLRFTINRYNRIMERNVEMEALAQQDVIDKAMERNKDQTPEEREKSLWDAIRNNDILFMCIQTQSEAQWGLLHSIMSCMTKNNLEVIDHRNWNPKGVNTALVNEVYCRDTLPLKSVEDDDPVALRLEQVKDSFEQLLPGEPKVTVTRWFPGIVQEIVEESTEKTVRRLQRQVSNITGKLFGEASMTLSAHQDVETGSSLRRRRAAEEPTAKDGPGASASAPAPPLFPAKDDTTKRRRRLSKTRSTPVYGASLFDGPTDADPSPDSPAAFGAPKQNPYASDRRKTSLAETLLEDVESRPAELLVDGEAFRIRVSPETLRNVRKGFRGDVVKGGLSVAPVTPLSNRLQGFVRNSSLGALGKISEDITDDASDVTDDKSDVRV